MIVACERCQTRFRLAKKRLPSQGAKVRCSRCQHTFHVKPEPPARDKHSIVQRVVENTAPVVSEDDPDLENPEFLNGGPPRQERGPGSRQAASAEADEAVLGLDAETQSGLEEPVLGFEDPKELGLRHDQEPSEPFPTEASFQPPPTELDFTTPPKQSGGSVDLGSDLESFRLEGPIEERGPGWQDAGSLETSQDSRVHSPFDPGVFDPEAPSIADEAPVPAKRARRWKSPRPQLRLHVASGIEALLRLLAYGVGLALIVAGGRAVLLFSISGAPEPTLLRGAGWTATHLEAFHAHGLAGERLLVVRGELSEGQTSRGKVAASVAPRISGRLLDAQGSLLGEEIRARPGRLKDEALTPDGFRDLFAEQAAPPSQHRARSARGRGTGAPDGFTLLFKNPPPEAARIQIQMRSPTDLAGSGS